MQDINELLKDPAVIWFLLGLGFLLSELVVPGLIILFFGIGCWVTSACLLLFPDLAFNAQMSIFLISSILSLALLRRSLKKWLKKKDGTDNDTEDYVNKHCLAETDIDVEIGGKVSFKGAVWDAVTKTHINKGDTVVIKGIDGIRLIIEPLTH